MIFLSPATSADTPASGVSLCHDSTPVCQTNAQAVSDIPCAERELDDAILELGQASERAMADGDPAGARIYSERMMAAIRSRTPQHQARLTAEADQRIDEARTTNGVCYFSSDAAQELGRARG